MATFNNPISNQGTSVPSVQAPQRSTAIADTINAATQLYQASRPAAPSQGQLVEGMKTGGMHAAAEVLEQYNHIRESDSPENARRFLNKEFRRGMGSMSATEFAEFSSQIRKSAPGSLEEVQRGWESEAEKADFDQMQEWKRMGQTLVGPMLIDSVDDDYLINRGQAYDAEVRRRTDDQARLAHRSAQRQEDTELRSREAALAVPDAMATATQTFSNIAHAVYTASDEDREQVRREGVAQLEALVANPSSFFRQFMPEGTQPPEHAINEFTKTAQLQIEFLTGRFDQEMDEQGILNMMSSIGSAFAASPGNSRPMTLMALSRVVGLDIGGMVTGANLDLGIDDNRPRMNLFMNTLLNAHHGIASSLDNHGLGASLATPGVADRFDSLVGEAYSAGRGVLEYARENDDLITPVQREQIGGMIANTLLDVSAGRRDQRQLALASGGFSHFLEGLNRPLPPKTRDAVEQAFEREGTTALTEWREGFSTMVREVLEPSLSKQDPKLVNSIRFEQRDGRIRASVDWTRYNSGRTETDMRMGRPQPIRANERQSARVSLVLSKVEREINKYLESYVNATNGEKSDVMEAMLGTLEARRRFSEEL